MSSKKICDQYLMTYSYTINNMKNKSNKLNNFFPSKPNFLKHSKISKMVKSVNNESLHEKWKTNSNSFFTKDEIDKINKRKDKYIYIKINNNKVCNENNDNKENINLNYQQKFRTINTDKNNIPKNKKTKPINKNKEKRENKNSILKKYNLNKFKKQNEFIINSKTIQKDIKNKDIIKSKISELSSLKKLIFENNSFKNMKFFKKLSKSRNICNVSYISNRANTMNNISYRLKKHKKTKTEDINKNFFFDRTKIYDLINSKRNNKTRKINRNFNINISHNNFSYCESNTIEKNKTYSSPKQFTKEDENDTKENIILGGNNNINDSKCFRSKLKKEIIFDKKKLIEKIQKKKITQSLMLQEDKKDKIFNGQIQLIPILKKQKFLIEKKILKSPKKVIKIDSCTVPGISPITNIHKENQESYSVRKELLNLNEHFLLEISSGHGSHGHLISKFICNILPSKINNLTEENIQQSFMLTNKLLLTKSKIDCSLSGASFTSIIVTPEKIISANVGICKAVLALYENGQYTAINLTKDHNINDINEMKRIINNGGIIKNGIKIYIKNSDIPGINTTRSFGDKLGMGIGVLDIPFIQNYYLKGNEKFILLASKGIWEFIDSDESVKIIKNFYENEMDASGALNTIVREAISRWKNEKNYFEDITAILLFFD